MNQGVNTMTKQIHWGQAPDCDRFVGALAGAPRDFRDPRALGGDVGWTPRRSGIATRAQAALAANDLPTAVKLAESAVEYRPQDAAFRALLGNIYLASGPLPPPRPPTTTRCRFLVTGRR